MITGDNIDTYHSIKYRIEGPLKANDPGLIQFIKQEFLIPPSTQEYNLSTSSFYQQLAKSLSWDTIHKFLIALFKDESPGFFLEAGALDGEYLSNTLWLEKEKGWTGLLVEPDPTNFAALLKKNRKAWIANAGVSTVPYPEKVVFSMVDLSINKKTWRNIAGLWTARAQVFDSERGFSLNSTQFHDGYISAQCFPLETFLLALNISTVDFLSLDIQGREWEALKLFPFDRIKIRSMVVEYYVNGIPWKYSPELVQYFQERGFMLVGMSWEPDYFFINTNDKLWL